jgi:hypothetical protein
LYEEGHTHWQYAGGCRVPACSVRARPATTKLKGYPTGDLARAREDGRVELAGRIKDTSRRCRGLVQARSSGTRRLSRLSRRRAEESGDALWRGLVGPKPARWAAPIPLLMMKARQGDQRRRGKRRSGGHHPETSFEYDQRGQPPVRLESNRMRLVVIIVAALMIPGLAASGVVLAKKGAAPTTTAASNVRIALETER